MKAPYHSSTPLLCCLGDVWTQAPEGSAVLEALLGLLAPQGMGLVITPFASSAQEPSPCLTRLASQLQHAPHQPSAHLDGWLTQALAAAPHGQWDELTLAPSPHEAETLSPVVVGLLNVALPRLVAGGGYAWVMWVQPPAAMAQQWPSHQGASLLLLASADPPTQVQPYEAWFSTQGAGVLALQPAVGVVAHDWLPWQWLGALPQQGIAQALAAYLRRWHCPWPLFHRSC